MIIPWKAGGALLTILTVGQVTHCRKQHKSQRLGLLVLMAACAAVLRAS